jgi:2-keto-3-deoxy-6-phosphogluconate aldolase
VLAFASTAVPETLGGAGVLFEPKDMEYAAELLGQLAFDPGVRASVIQGQRLRLRDFAEDQVRTRLAQVVRDASGT